MTLGAGTMAEKGRLRREWRHQKALGFQGAEVPKLAPSLYSPPRLELPLHFLLWAKRGGVMGLCISELHHDTRSNSKFTYSRTDMQTVEEKIDTVRTFHIHSVTLLRHSDKRED
ncbi:hypothetical protein U0070_023282 [Myodes glareolus]|uniref:Uncharacterized protein n=1 Tax=Myodes glareolus TaxID=447135 RepID=A0AAW0IDP3_MYOGA